MSGHEYSRVTIPPETAESINAQVEREISEIRVAMNTAGGSGSVAAVGITGTSTTTSWTGSAVAGAVTRRTEKLVESLSSSADQNTVRHAAAAFVQASSEQAAVAAAKRLEATEQRVLSDEARRRTERLTTEAVAARLLRSRPRGVELQSLDQTADGVRIRMRYRGDRVDAVVQSAGERDTEISVHAHGHQVIERVDGTQEVVCHGLDELFEGMLQTMRADGVHATARKELAPRAPVRGAARRQGTANRQTGGGR